MVDISVWMQQFLNALREYFGDRIWFVGLQGSHSRGEATEKSDIDVVVILDELSTTDIQTYNHMLDTLPNRELICGFLSGKTELLHWDPADLFQLYHDTRPIVGSLNELTLLLDEDSVKRAIKMGVCNIYHGCVHNMLYEKSDEILQGLYKSASFVVQAICYQQTGTYHRLQSQLRNNLLKDEQVIVDTFLKLKNGGTVAFEEMSETLFTWCGKWIEKMK